MANDQGTQALSRKERERLAHRREILEAAERVFARNGYRGATVEQIAQEAEFAVGTLYNFFRSKEELYEEVLASLVEGAVAQFKQRLAGEVDPVAAVEAVIELRVALLDQHKGFARVVFQSPLGEHGDPSLLRLPPRCLAMIEEAQAIFRSILERGIAAGIFVDIGAADLALCIQGILNAFIGQWLVAEPKEPAAERVARLRKNIFGLILRGKN